MIRFVPCRAPSPALPHPTHGRSLGSTRSRDRRALAAGLRADEGRGLGDGATACSPQLSSDNLLLWRIAKADAFRHGPGCGRVRGHGGALRWHHPGWSRLPPAEASSQDALAHREPAALLLDTFEAALGLEDWLREQFVPSLPACALVVVAARNRPGAPWRGAIRGGASCCVWLPCATSGRTTRGPSCVARGSRRTSRGGWWRLLRVRIRRARRAMSPNASASSMTARSSSVRGAAVVDDDGSGAAW
jgi:hypothetical protein